MKILHLKIFELILKKELPSAGIAAKASFYRRVMMVTFGIFFLSGLSGQELNIKPWFASEIEVVDSLDSQLITCTAYRLGDKVIYDSPEFLRLHPGQYYHLKFRFRLYNGWNEVNHLNYQQKSFQLEIVPSDPEKFKINAVTPRDNGVSVYGISSGENGDLAAFEIRLTSPNGQLAGNGNFKLVIPTQKLDIFYPNYMHEVPMDPFMLRNYLKDNQDLLEKIQGFSRSHLEKLKKNKSIEQN